MAAITAQAQGYTRRDRKTGAEYSAVCVVTNHSWSLGSSDTVDFRAQLPGLQLGVVAGCYVDNTLNTSALRILCPSPYYFVDIPAGYCGYFPVFMRSLQSVTVMCVNASTGTTEIVWLDEQIEPAIWSGGQGNLSSIPVTDTVLESTVHPLGTASGQAVAVQRPDGGQLAQDGTDATGIIPPAGASGIRGWLSSIYNYTLNLYNVLNAAYTPRGPSASPIGGLQMAGTYNSAGVALTNGQSGALQVTSVGSLQTHDDRALALDGTDGAGISQLNGGVGIRGWLAGIYYWISTYLQGVYNNTYAVSQAVSSKGPSAASLNALQLAGVYNSAGVALTNGQSVALQVDALGRVITGDAYLQAIFTPTASATPIIRVGLVGTGQALSDASTTTLGTTSTALVSANRISNYLLIQTKANPIAISWGSAAVIGGAGSIDIPANSTFKLNVTDVIPYGSVLNAIASAAGTTVTVKYA